MLLTAAGWGLNWPAMKLLVGELPPLALRAWPGLAGAAILACLALAMGESLAVRAAVLPRLILISLLNVTSWMGLAIFSLYWLSASEAAITCYTMPIWTVIFAWPVLGERPTARRLIALAIGFAGVAVLMLGHGIEIGLAKLPGVLFASGAALLFAIGTVVTKRWPVTMPPLAGAAWQVGIGCVPLMALSLAFEAVDPASVPASRWLLLAYAALVPLCICYAGWFAALRRLPASVASVGTLMAPVVGVIASATALGEPFGAREVLALVLTLGGVVLAARG
nr:DMT family transporter [Plastoroseomonas hellenica]